MSTEKEKIVSDEEVKENLEAAPPIVSDEKALEELAETMPEVVPEAVEAAKQKDDEVKKFSENVVDKKGRPFDPSIHAIGPDGKPVVTPTGRFTKIRTPKQAGVNIPAPEKPVDQSYKVVAQTLVGVFIQTGYAVVGDEWLPEKTKDFDEQGNLINVTEAYCASIGLQDLPPGLVCATAFIGYGLRRMNRPRTKSFVERATSGIKLFFVNMWLKIRGVKGVKVVEDDKKKR